MEAEDAERAARAGSGPDPDASDDAETATLLRAVTLVGEHYYAAAAAAGLTVQQARLLFVIAAHPTNMLGLSALESLPKSTMTGVMARMARDGLIEWRPHPEDRRHRIAVPTLHGRERAAAFAQDLRTRVGDVLAVLTDEQRDELGHLVSDVLRDAPDQVLAAPAPPG